MWCRELVWCLQAQTAWRSQSVPTPTPMRLSQLTQPRWTTTSMEFALQLYEGWKVTSRFPPLAAVNPTLHSTPRRARPTTPRRRNMSATEVDTVDEWKLVAEEYGLPHTGAIKRVVGLDGASITALDDSLLRMAGEYTSAATDAPEAPTESLGGPRGAWEALHGISLSTAAALRCCEEGCGAGWKHAGVLHAVSPWVIPAHVGVPQRPPTTAPPTPSVPFPERGIVSEVPAPLCGGGDAGVPTRVYCTRCLGTAAKRGASPRHGCASRRSGAVGVSMTPTVPLPPSDKTAAFERYRQAVVSGVAPLRGPPEMYDTVYGCWENDAEVGGEARCPWSTVVALHAVRGVDGAGREALVDVVEVPTDMRGSSYGHPCGTEATLPLLEGPSLGYGPWGMQPGLIVAVHVDDLDTPLCGVLEGRGAPRRGVSTLRVWAVLPTGNAGAPLRMGMIDAATWRVAPGSAWVRGMPQASSPGSPMGTLLQQLATTSIPRELLTCVLSTGGEGTFRPMRPLVWLHQAEGPDVHRILGQILTDPAFAREIVLGDSASQLAVLRRATRGALRYKAANATAMSPAQKAMRECMGKVAVVFDALNNVNKSPGERSEAAKKSRELLGLLRTARRSVPPPLPTSTGAIREAEQLVVHIIDAINAPTREVTRESAEKKLKHVAPLLSNAVHLEGKSKDLPQYSMVETALKAMEEDMALSRITATDMNNAVEQIRKGEEPSAAFMQVARTSVRNSTFQPLGNEWALGRLPLGVTARAPDVDGAVCLFPAPRVAREQWCPPGVSLVDVVRASAQAWTTVHFMEAQKTREDIALPLHASGQLSKAAALGAPVGALGRAVRVCAGDAVAQWAREAASADDAVHGGAAALEVYSRWGARRPPCTSALGAGRGGVDGAGAAAAAGAPPRPRKTDSQKDAVRAMQPLLGDTQCGVVEKESAPPTERSVPGFVRDAALLCMSTPQREALMGAPLRGAGNALARRSPAADNPAVHAACVVCLGWALASSPPSSVLLYMPSEKADVAPQLAAPLPVVVALAVAGVVMPDGGILSSGPQSVTCSVEVRESGRKVLNAGSTPGGEDGRLQCVVLTPPFAAPRAPTQAPPVPPPLPERTAAFLGGLVASAVGGGQGVDDAAWRVDAAYRACWYATAAHRATRAAAEDGSAPPVWAQCTLDPTHGAREFAQTVLGNATARGALWAEHFAGGTLTEGSPTTLTTQALSNDSLEDVSRGSGVRAGGQGRSVLTVDSVGL